MHLSAVSLGGVSRQCRGDAAAMSRLSRGYVAAVSRRCLGHVSAVSRRCLGGLSPRPLRSTQRGPCRHSSRARAAGRRPPNHTSRCEETPFTAHAAARTGRRPPTTASRAGCGTHPPMKRNPRVKKKYDDKQIWRASHQLEGTAAGPAACSSHGHDRGEPGMCFCLNTLSCRAWGVASHQMYR